MLHTYRLSTAILFASVALAASAHETSTLGPSSQGAPARETKPSTLDIGDLAPPLKPAEWLKGKPVPAFEKGKVYIVEFWATWCESCRIAMPKLSALARKYDKRAIFIGMDGFEPSELAKVAAFVKMEGTKMDYRVATDGPKGRSAFDWLHAAGETGIPITFLVDKNGRIAWIGHSPEELDEILPPVLAGKHDLVAEKARRAGNRNPHDAIEIAMGERNYAKAVTLIEAEGTKHPETPHPFTLDEYVSLAHFDIPKLRRRVREDVERTHDEFGIYNWAVIALLADGLSVEAYRFGMEVVGEALKVSDSKLMFLARGADLASKAGDPARAVEFQTQALAAAETTPACTEERKAELRKDLERYKAAAGVKGA